jgi:hypothetical protein
MKEGKSHKASITGSTDHLNCSRCSIPQAINENLSQDELLDIYENSSL